MNPVVTTEPTAEPISLETLKRHLRLPLDYTDEDAYLTGLGKRVRQWAEVYCWRSWPPQERKATYDDWPHCDYFRLAYGPVRSITSVEYTLEDGSTETLASSIYFLDTSHEPARLHLADNREWPTATLRKAAAIEITYECGFEAVDEVPEDVIGAMLLKAESLYNNRGDEVMGVNIVPTKLENSAEALLAPWVAR